MKSETERIQREDSQRSSGDSGSSSSNSSSDLTSVSMDTTSICLQSSAEMLATNQERERGERGVKENAQTERDGATDLDDAPTPCAGMVVETVSENGRSNSDPSASEVAQELNEEACSEVSDDCCSGSGKNCGGSEEAQERAYQALL